MKRKNFLKLSSLSFVSFLLPIHQVDLLSFILKLDSYNPEDHPKAREIAEEARVAFYKRQFDLAERLFLECIRLAPADIRFYDNLQNVYGAQNKVLEIVELYNNGLSVNSKKISFYDRTARALMRLELGYKRQASEYKKNIRSVSLLKDAQVLYEKAIEIDKKDYLFVGLDKVQRMIAKKAPDINYRKNKDEIRVRKERRHLHAQRYQNFDNKVLISKIEELDAKKRRELFIKGEIDVRQKNIIKEKKLIYRTLIDRFTRNKDYDSAILYAKKIYDLDSKDTAIKNTIKSLYKFNKDYLGVVNFKKSYALKSDNIFEHLGLMKALNEAYVRGEGDFSFLTESSAIGEYLIEEWVPLPKVRMIVVDKLCATYNLVGDYEKSFNLLTEELNRLSTTSSSSINALLYRYGETLMYHSNFEEARDFVLICLEEKEYNSIKYPQFDFLSTCLELRNDSNFNSKSNLWYLLYEIYSKYHYDYIGIEVLDKILSYSPSDQFAIKRKNS